MEENMNKSITVTHHELILDILPLRSDSPVTPLTNVSILDIFKALKTWDYETKNRMYGNSRFCGLLPVMDIKATKNRINLILSISDKDADNPIARDFNNVNRTRELGRNETEGLETSTHVVISLDPQNPRNAKFAIEHKTGLTPKLFVDTLNYFLRDAKLTNEDYFKGNHPTQNDVNGNPIQVPFRANFRHESVLSQEVIDAFDKGRVHDVLFHEKLPATDYDSAGNYRQKKRTVYLDVGAKIISDKSKTISEKVKEIKASFSNIVRSHPTLQGITFTIKFDNANGHPQTATYDTETQEFSLAKKTYLSEDLKQKATATPTINKPLCDKIFSHI